VINPVAAELSILVTWIHERESIRSKKERSLPRPWTTDPLLRDFRWCNVRRMDDLVSRQLLKHWYAQGRDVETDLTAATLARLVNWPPALFEIAGVTTRFNLTDTLHARDKLRVRAARGEKVFTGAYVVPGVPGRNKVDSVCDVVSRVQLQAWHIARSTMRETWHELVGLDGLGSFLAGQIVADVVHLETGRAWKDADTWAPIGPGSARGINRLLGRPKDKPVRQEQFDRELPALMHVLYPEVRPVWDDRQLQAMDIQNCLCEFDKYRRLQLGEGKVRSTYPGATEQAALL
jgi:hypothetical protein